MSTYYVVNEATIPSLYLEHPTVKAFLRHIGGNIHYTDSGDVSFDVRTEYVYDGFASVHCKEWAEANRILEELIKHNMVSIVFNYEFDSGCGYDEPEGKPEDFAQYLSNVPSLVLREVLAMRQE